MADRTVVLEFQLDVDESVESINKLTAANKQLRQERNALNLSTEQGKKRAQEINAAIDQNTSKIKANVSAIEQQKINIGNYKSALDGVHPALGKVATGIESTTKAAWAFIATPIGAVIGALSLAVAALTAYFKGSEEGQDRLTKITTILSVAMNKLMLVVEAVGEALFNGAEGFGSMTKKLGIFGVALDIAIAPLKLLLLGLEQVAKLTGFDKVIEDAVKTGEAIAELNDKIDARENELIVKRAETNARVQALREEAIKQEGKLKEDTINEAIRLEKELAAEERKQHEDRLKAFDLEAATTGRLTEEQKKQRAELLAAIINAEAEGASSTIKFQKEIERLREEGIKTTQKQIETLKEQEAQERAVRRAQSGGETGGLDSEIALINARQELQIDAELHKAQTIAGINERMARDLKKINEKQAKDDAEIQQKKLEIYEAAELTKLDITADVLGSVASLTREGSTEYKVISSLQALISTYTGAQKSYEALASIPYVGPALGTAAAAAAVVAGLARVAQINGIQFAEGGWTGPGQKWDVAGVVHADEYVVPKRVVNSPAASYHVEALERMRLAPYADGGMVTRTISNPINQSLELANVMKNLGPFEVGVREITKMQNRVRVKENISKI